MGQLFDANSATGTLYSLYITKGYRGDDNRKSDDQLGPKDTPKFVQPVLTLLE